MLVSLLLGHLICMQYACNICMECREACDALSKRNHSVTLYICTLLPHAAGQAYSSTCLLITNHDIVRNANTLVFCCKYNFTCCLGAKQKLNCSIRPFKRPTYRMISSWLLLCYLKYYLADLTFFSTAKELGEMNLKLLKFAS